MILIVARYCYESKLVQLLSYVTIHLIEVITGIIPISNNIEKCDLIKKGCK